MEGYKINIKKSGVFLLIYTNNETSEKEIEELFIHNSMRTRKYQGKKINQGSDRSIQ